jgi:hypothetical protein
MCAAIPTRADWQYTTWGMTRSEVVAASAGKAHLSTNLSWLRMWGAEPGVEGTHSEYAMDFRTIFYFDSTGALKIVHLMGMGEQCRALQDQIEADHGLPKGRTEKAFPKATSIREYWMDAKKGNVVHLSITAAHAIPNDTVYFCQLDYAPLDNNDENGVPHFE